MLCCSARPKNNEPDWWASMLLSPAKPELPSAKKAHVERSTSPDTVLSSPAKPEEPPAPPPPVPPAAVRPRLPVGMSWSRKAAGMSLASPEQTPPKAAVAGMWA